MTTIEENLGSSWGALWADTKTPTYFKKSEYDVLWVGHHYAIIVHRNTNEPVVLRREN